MCNDKWTTLEWEKWEKYKADGHPDIPKGIEIERCVKVSQDEIIPFVKNYSLLYFSDDEKCKLSKPKRYTRQGGSDAIEQLIYSPWLGDGEISAVDILRVLAWKTGKIDYDKCVEVDGRITLKYYKNWNEGEEDGKDFSIQLPYQNKVSYDEFKLVVEKINGLRTKCILNSEKSVNEIWSELLQFANGDGKEIMKGIGTVYLITLLHFITKCKYPIYDRFAMSSLVVCYLQNHKEVIPEDSIIRGCALPDKNSEAAKSLLSDTNGRYQKYIRLLKTHCSEKYKNENEYIENRNVDRALYVYGHFFKCE